MIAVFDGVISKYTSWCKRQREERLTELCKIPLRIVQLKLRMNSRKVVVYSQGKIDREWHRYQQGLDKQEICILKARRKKLQKLLGLTTSD